MPTLITLSSATPVATIDLQDVETLERENAFALDAHAVTPSRMNTEPDDETERRRRPHVTPALGRGER